MLELPKTLGFIEDPLATHSVPKPWCSMEWQSVNLLGCSLLPRSRPHTELFVSGEGVGRRGGWGVVDRDRAREHYRVR
jgi:hypothetical protein